MSVSSSSSNPDKARKVKKRVLCGYGVDIDAVAGWLGSYGGEDSTSDISRGLLPFLYRYQHLPIFFTELSNINFVVRSVPMPADTEGA